MYELSSALTGLRTQEAVAHTVARAASAVIPGFFGECDFLYTEPDR